MPGDASGEKHALLELGDPMKSKKRIERTLKLITKYGSTDIAEHKQWLLDQLVRTLTGCPVVETLELDARGKPYTYKKLGMNDTYLQWIKDYRSGGNGPETYDWDTGIAP